MKHFTLVFASAFTALSTAAYAGSATFEPPVEAPIAAPVPGELDYDFSDISLSGGAGDIDNISRAKVKAGYDLGSTLLYATAGIARADTDLGTDNGEFYGVGVNYQFSPAWTLGGEILAHQFEDFNATGTDIDVDTISLRASYNF